jgi:hypothetical protein
MRSNAKNAPFSSHNTNTAMLLTQQRREFLEGRRESALGFIKAALLRARLFNGWSSTAHELSSTTFL